MTPADAVATAREFFSKLTGVSERDMLDRRRGVLIDTARNLAGFHLYEIVGPTKQDGWLAEISPALKRDHSTVRHAGLTYDWRRGTITKKVAGELVTTQHCSPELSRDIDNLFAWAELHWLDPPALRESYKAVVAKARKRFKATLRYWQTKRGSKRFHAEDVFRAVAAMGRAVPKIERGWTSVPLIDDPEPMRIIRRAPAVKRLEPILEVAEAYGGGHYLVAIVSAAIDKAEQKARDLLRSMTQALDALGYAAKQSTFGRDNQGRGWKAVLHVAAASIALALAPFHPWQDGRTEVVETA